jgi:hypothetical protein
MPMGQNGFSKSKLQIDIVLPFELFMVITKTKQIGSRSILNCIGDSEGINGICGAIGRTFLLLTFQLKWLL